jgi:hypothetical protein
MMTWIFLQDAADRRAATPALAREWQKLQLDMLWDGGVIHQTNLAYCDVDGLVDDFMFFAGQRLCRSADTPSSSVCRPTGRS